MNNKWYQLEIEEVLKLLNTNYKGISQKEAEIRLEKNGFNIIEDKKSESPIIMFLKQFNNSLIYILIIASGISFIAGQIKDTIIILVVVLINAIIGFLQEWQADKSIQALKNTVKNKAKVLRDGEINEILTRDLVVGDIIQLEEGDKVPADARLFHIKEFQTVESSLTGESLPEDKVINKIENEAPISDQENMVWMGTFVSKGTSKAIVVETGMSTAIGKIATDITSIENTKTHFHEKTDKLGFQLSLIAFVGAGIVLAIGFYRQVPLLETFLFTLSVLISSIPEGLPAILAIVLSIGAKRMAKHNAIVRTLPIIESLSVASVIITDKTGTLTQNTMTVKKIFLANNKEFEVTGEGWIPKGDFIYQDKEIIPLDNKELSQILHSITLAQNSTLVLKEKNGQKEYTIVGDPTEGALNVLGEKAGLKKEVISKDWKIIDEIPFNSDRKYRAIKVKINEKYKILVIGAIDSLSLLSNEKDVLDLMQSKAIAFSLDALRVIAVGSIDDNGKQEQLLESHIKDIKFLGLVAMEDPVRPEVKQAMIEAKQAGLKVIMATGDHKATALSIAKQIDLVDSSTDLKSVYDEQDLLKLNKDDFSKVILNHNIFARLTPHMKLRIADIYQKSGYIIAMTGDGVNDAPALKKADIGFSMGKIGTDVAREASDIILTDDNFATILKAIEEGRVIARNIAQTSVNLVGGSLFQLVVIILAMVYGTPSPLLASQVLWINLITSGISDIVLATEPSHKNELTKKPVSSKQNILSGNNILAIAILTISAVIPTFILYITYYFNIDTILARTVLFAIICFYQIFTVYSIRSLEIPILKLGIFSNKTINWGIGGSIIVMILVLITPFFQDIFQLTNLRIIDWIIVILFSIFPIMVYELYKTYKFTKSYLQK